MATSDRPVRQPDGPLAGLRVIDAGTMIAGPLEMDFVQLESLGLCARVERRLAAYRY